MAFYARSHSTFCTGGEMAVSKVETISRLVQWRIEKFGTDNIIKSEPFRVGVWKWHLTIEKGRTGRCMYIRLFPEPSETITDQPPIARFVLRIFNTGPNRKVYVSPVQEKMLRSGDDFSWPVDFVFSCPFIVDVEFLDLKVCPVNGEEANSIWPSNGPMESLASQSPLRCLSRMLDEAIHADVTINAVDGTLRAHKAILAASSPVFESMFLHNLKEKESSTIDIEDMSQVSCAALLSYLYGTIKQKDFWKHRLALLAAANKYDIAILRDSCEESLLEDINSGNVLERLQEAWLYQLNKLKKRCLTYLLTFGKIYDLGDEINCFFQNADRELTLALFQEMVNLWKPA